MSLIFLTLSIVCLWFNASNLAIVLAIYGAAESINEGLLTIVIKLQKREKIK